MDCVAAWVRLEGGKGGTGRRITSVRPSFDAFANPPSNNCVYTTNRTLFCFIKANCKRQKRGKTRHNEGHRRRRYARGRRHRQRDRQTFGIINERWVGVKRKPAVERSPRRLYQPSSISGQTFSRPVIYRRRLTNAKWRAYLALLSLSALGRTHCCAV